MKRIHKTIALILALLTLVSLLGACGKEETKETAPAGIEWPKLSPAELHNDVLKGDWETDSAVLTFDGSEHFWFADGKREKEGRYQFDGLDLYLKDRAENVYRGYMDRDGNLRLDNYPKVFESSAAKLNLGLVGEWSYQSGDIVLDFYEDGSYQWNRRDDSGAGEYFYNGSELSLMENGEVTWAGHVDDQNKLYLDDLVGWFYWEDSESYVPLPNSQQALLAPDLEPAAVRHTMDNAIALHREDLDFFQRVPADWSVEQAEIPYDEEPELKAFSVVAACYLPYRNMPAMSEPVRTQCNFILYDRYTGLSFPFSNVYKDDDDIYHYSFDSRDGRVDLLIVKEEKNLGPTGECSSIMSVNLTIVMPRWYDGLVFAGYPSAESIEEVNELAGGNHKPYSSSVLSSPEEKIEASLTFAIG